MYQRGFSVIEVIVAIAILASAGVALWILSAISLRTVRIARQELIAANLAQEGIEIVRNIRDSNWLDDRRADDDGTNCAPAPPVSWRDGLCNGQWRVSYTEQNLLAVGANPRLRIDTDGFYQYDS